MKKFFERASDLLARYKAQFAFALAIGGTALAFHATKAAVTVEQVVASSTEAVDAAGGVYLQSFLALLPTLLKWIIPIGLVWLAVGYFIHKKKK